ncbi:Beta-galactosidase BglY [compost metagenome]
MFDWDNRWAVKDAQGPRNMGIHYEKTVIQHYRAFWELGIPVDIIGPEDDLSGYKLVAAPMLYLCTQAAGEKLERFVRGGGTLASTYWSGIVDEHDLCHLGGFPGPLRQVLGIWAEEMDALYDGEQNGIVLAADAAGALPGLAAEYDAGQLCELVHAETAEVLGVYREDFYAGRPALTVNRLGQGRAYYLATRAADPFYRDYYRELAKEAGVEPLLPVLPEGVSVQARSSGTEEYLFVMNFNGSAREVALDRRQYRDVESGETLTGGILELTAYGVRILARQVQV